MINVKSVGHSIENNLSVSAFLYSLIGIGVLRYRGRYLIKVTVMLRVIQIVLVYYSQYKYLLRDEYLPKYSFLSMMVIIGINTCLITYMTFNLVKVFFWRNDITNLIDDISKIIRKFQQFDIVVKSDSILLLSLIAEIVFMILLIIFEFTEHVTKSRQQFLILMGILIPRSFCIYTVSSFIRYIYVIYLQYKEVNDQCYQMKNVTSSTSWQMCLLKMLREQHRDITRTARKVTRLYQPYLLMGLTLHFLGFIYHIYVLYKIATTKNADTPDSTYYISFMLVTQLIQLFSLCHVCTTALAEKDKTGIILHEVMLNKPSLQIRTEVSSFFTYLEFQRMTISVGKMFNIDNSFIASFYMVSISYIMILIQVA